jgi:acetoin:2,6-dichlorophenolindophenol oxidoreductase subunit beta
MSKLTFLQGAYQAQLEEMERDDTVILIGQDLEANLYGSAENFVERFGKKRIRGLPISEAATVGMAAGAAMSGLRPIVDLTIASFMYCAMDQIVNQVAKAHYMSGGQAMMPMVIRAGMFYNGGNAAQHSDRPYPMFMSVPGLKIIAPTTGSDLKGLLKSAIRDNNPVLSFEDTNLWGRAGSDDYDPDSGDHTIRIGEGVIRRIGDDVTVVGIANGCSVALGAAEALSAEGISCEVIDPRTLAPMDWPLLARSVQRTGRLVIVDPAVETCSAASQIAAYAAEHWFSSLKAPVARVASLNVHAPYSAILEKQLYPTSDRAIKAVQQVLAF